jgi:hypothetical protein
MVLAGPSYRLPAAATDPPAAASRPNVLDAPSSRSASGSRLLVLAVAVAVALATAPGAAAGVDRWTSIGPVGGPVLDLATTAQGDALFAATSAGIFRSVDHAESWQRVLAPSDRGEDFHQVALSSDDARVVVAAAGQAVYRSADGGATWTSVLTASSAQVAYHPADGSFVAWTTVAVGGDGYTRVWHSGDGGATWQAAGDNLAFFLAPPVPHPSRAGVFFALDSRTVVGSDDGGVTWQHLGAFPDSLPQGRCQLAVDAADGDRIYVLCSRSDAPPQVLRSDDGGASVRSVTTAGLPAVRPAALRVSGAGLLAATAGSGVYRSDDQGEHWEPLAAGLETAAATSLAVAADGSLWTGTADGVFALRTGGGTWRAALSGLTAFDARALTVDPASGDLVVGGADGSVRRRPRGAEVWLPLGGGLGNGSVGALARTPSGYLASLVEDGLAATDQGGLFRWSEGDTAWERLAALQARGFAADPLDATQVYAFTPHQLARWSEDGGLSLLPSLAEVGLIADLAVSPQVPDLLFAATSSGMAVSHDGGEGWSEEALPGGPGRPRPVSVIALQGDPAGALASGDDLFSRNLFGWQVASPGRFDSCRPGPLACDARRPGTLYAASCRGFERSLDGGAGWQELGEGLPQHLLVYRIVADTIDPDRLYLATEEGVYERRFAAAPSLSLGDGRFEVRVAWRDPRGNTGTGTPHPLTADTGAFWFFNPNNLELVVKALDGRPINGRWWIFFASLSNVEYEVTVSDTVTGAAATYVNPGGTFASRGDTRALPASSAAGPARSVPRAASSVASPAATAVPHVLLLRDGRFRVAVEWEDFQGNSGGGVAAPLTSDTGAFWFFRPDNLELVVKVLDGRPVNGHWWVFAGALTNVAYRLTVTDTVSGVSHSWNNSAGTFASFGDTRAFTD